MKKEEKLKLEKPEIFINRVDETKYFLDYFSGIPRNILFVYWPKSTGKTTLINKIVNENLDNENYAVQYINMRDVLIKDFADFRNLFFPENLKGKMKWIVSGVKFNFWFFGWDIDDEKMFKSNIFGVMLEKLKKAKENWIKPVIILDEFQYLKDIIIDKENNLTLVKELFKFFISITKQYNLAHVVCLTSDSYYMEELYSDTKLANTSMFYLMEHLNKKDIYYWLEDLEKIDKKIVDKIWKNLWWSVWEIWQVLVSYKNNWDYKYILDDLLQVKYSLIKEWYNFLEEWLSDLDLEEKGKNKIKQKIKIFLNIIEKIVKKWKFIRWKDWIANFELIKELVDKDIWFYDTKQLKITANSKSLEKAFKRLLKEVK